LELNNYLEAVSDTEERKQEIKRLWPAATAAFQGLVAGEPGLAESIETRPLDAAFNDYLAGIKREPAFAKTFANFPISFEEVEIAASGKRGRYPHVSIFRWIADGGILGA
jgi:hypothetical protein